jgi:hypothetical protein
MAIAFAVVWLLSSPPAHGVKPPPDGDYRGENTAEGEDALFSLITGVHNTALGFHALFSDTSGSDNTATGANVLSANTIGIRNTATGANALANNISGNSNTADGVRALFHNTTGFDNTASGHQALFRNTTGSGNTAYGDDALFANKTGSGNTATGVAALLHNRTGIRNTANGNGALFSDTRGSDNIALGDSAGFFLSGDNNINIGNVGRANESNKIRIGTSGRHDSTFVAGIFGVPVSGSQVTINSDGQLGVATSSARFKEEIRPMGKTSEVILRLKPVSFRYNDQIDPRGLSQFGLLAEEVDKVDSALVVHDERGRPYTVRYDAVNAMLLNEFVKEHQRVQQLQSSDAEQKQEIAELKRQLHEQADAIRKVSERVELNAQSKQLIARQQ